MLARVKATKRRYNIEQDLLNYDIFSLDLINRKVETDNAEKIDLTDKEFELLKYFILNKGTVINKESMCKYVWKLNFVPKTNVCEATVKNLRKKLEESTGKKYIKTIYGEGYILIDD